MAACNVSHETARRDLKGLQEMGIERRVHGGAILISESNLQAIAWWHEQLCAG